MPDELRRGRNDRVAGLRCLQPRFSQRTLLSKNGLDNLDDTRHPFRCHTTSKRPWRSTMSDLRFLITGATGATGGAAAAQLLEQGRRVRALVHREDERAEKLRRLGAEVVVGDLLDFDAVSEALEDVDRAYFVYPIQPGLVQATAQFAQSAKEAGVEAI